MKLFDQSTKTNWKFIAIVAFVAVFLAGGILMLIPQFQEQPPPLPQPNIPQVDTSGDTFDSGIEKIVSFYNLEGIEKKVILYNTYDQNYNQTENFYLTDKDLNKSSTIKLLEVVGSDVGGFFISPGYLKKKYIVIQFSAGDYADLFVADEEGKIITKSIKLGNLELGAYPLEFMHWESSTTFQAKAIPYSEGLPSYFIIVDAVTGKVLDKTQLNTGVSTWQTYRNDELGFELKYPNDWEVLERNDQTIDLSPNSELTNVSAAGNFIEIESFLLDGSKSPQEIMIRNTFLGESDRNPESFDAFTERKFGDNSFFYIHNYISEGQHGGIYYAVDDKQVLSFRFVAYIDMDIFTGKKSFTATQEEKKAATEEGVVHSTLKQILSTFRFVDKAVSKESPI